jgi:hypothetical protein
MPWKCQKVRISAADMARRKILAIVESEAFSDPEGTEVKIEAVAKRGRGSHRRGLLPLKLKAPRELLSLLLREFRAQIPVSGALRSEAPQLLY